MPPRRESRCRRTSQAVLPATLTAALAVFLVALAHAQQPAPPSGLRLVALDTGARPKVRGLLDVKSPAPPAAPAGPLSAAEFRLSGDDSKQTGSRMLKFRDTKLPLALTIVLDASASMRGGPLTAIRNGIAQLVTRKRDGDRVAILSFADDLRWEARWDASDADKQNALRTFETRGRRTRLYDGIWQALDELEAQAVRDADFPSRTCVLVMSDGHDEGSGNTLNQVVARARASHARIDAVGLARTPAWLKNLQAVADAGFGDFRTTSTPDELTTLLERGLDSSLDAPVVEFDNPSVKADGKPHRFTLEHTPTRWRAEADVTMPVTPFVERPEVWIAGAAGVCAVAGLGFLLLRTRARRPPPPKPAVSAAPADKGRPSRAATTVEPSAYAAAGAASAVPAPTAVEPRAAESQVRARQATMLAPAETKQMALAGVSGPYAGQRFDLAASEFWLGSSPNNHLVLANDPAVSGNHACIRTEQQFHRLYDNESLNGTFVNGQPIGNQPALIRAGDHIRVGQSEFVFAP